MSARRQLARWLVAVPLLVGCAGRTHEPGAEPDAVAKGQAHELHGSDRRVVDARRHAAQPWSGAAGGTEDAEGHVVDALGIGEEERRAHGTRSCSPVTA